MAHLGRYPRILQAASKNGLSQMTKSIFIWHHLLWISARQRPSQFASHYYAKVLGPYKHPFRTTRQCHPVQSEHWHPTIPKMALTTNCAASPYPFLVTTQKHSHQCVKSISRFSKDVNTPNHLVQESCSLNQASKKRPPPIQDDGRSNIRASPN